MKRVLLLAGLLCLGLLTACSKSGVTSGEVVSYQLGDDGELASIVVKMESGKEREFALTENTWVHARVDGLTEEAFRAGPPPGTTVNVYTDQDGMVRTINVTGVLRTGAAVLSDGTLIDMMMQNNFDDHIYQLADGTELLTVRMGFGPDNVSVGGVDNFDDLSETAQEKVLAYYEEQGLLYDEQSTLEQAYAFYLEQGEDFQGGAVLEQTVTPTASNDQVIYFMTEVIQPAWDGSNTAWRLGACFDRETGELIENQDLFTCSEDEIMAAVLDTAKAYNEDFREETMAAFRPEYLVLSSDHLEVSFPKGTLPSQEYAHSVLVDYTDEFLTILNEWAVPDGAELA